MVKKVFVTGLGMVSPLGVDVPTTWNALTKGQSGISTIKSFDPSGFETTFAGEIPDFDPTLYVDRKQARRLDRFAQLAVAASAQALDNAKLDLRDQTVDANRVGVVIGSGIGGIGTLSEQWLVLSEKGPSRVNPFLVPMMLADMGSGQVSIIFGAKGPNLCTVTACSSGADAIGKAYEMILQGDIDIAIAGGAEAPITPIAVAGFNACMALSKQNDTPQLASRPFDINRDGFVMGEGSGVLIIESEESVNRRKVVPVAELIGYGSTSDSYHVTQPDPGGLGATRAMNKSLSNAKIDPEQVDYVNAHGTSTPLNDKFETLAIKNVFGNHAKSLKISSTKSMTGHLLGAAGGVEAVITIQTILEGKIPPTINLNDPDPECDLDYTPNYSIDKSVSVAMTNNLGFGGHNSSLIFKSCT